MNLTPVRTTSLMICVAVGLVTGCVPPPTSPDLQTPGNLSLDMRRIQVDLNRQEQQIKQLNERLSAAEEQLTQQRQELAEVREAARSATAVSPVQASTPISQPTNLGSSQQAGLSPTEIYLQAFGDYASGRYPEAIAGFVTFLQRFPNNSYASNAQYWLADCYLSQQQYNVALQQFQKLLDDYPRAPKQPEALLKIALIQQQLGDSQGAQETIEFLKTQHPDSDAARKADDLILP
ncbi:MAG: tol-pal system protein YbgF [Deltaproteobacteria bacterium]|jgi:tol-pal system protein YbgF|nr:tol-pal system protein YbgF [Deltaproteobacteria bacterium]MBW2505003.1 tol-pal system protein YbgF [Deltaproteobacteria bacterium]